MGKTVCDFDPETRAFTLISWEAVPMMWEKAKASPTLTEKGQEIATFLAVFQSHLNDALSEVIYHTDQALSIETIRTERVPIGTLVCDALLYATQDYSPDVALTNSGAFRGGLPAGDISKNDVYNILPFPNTLVVLELSGDILKEIILYSIENHINTGGFLQYSSNLEIRPDGDILINDTLINLTKTYKIVTNDFTAGGGDGYHQFSKAINTVDTAIEVKTALVEYLSTVFTNH